VVHFGRKAPVQFGRKLTPFTGRAAPLRLTQPEVLPVRAEELAELDQIFRQDASDAVLDRWPQVSLLTKQGSARAEAREAAREEELRRATASIPLTQYQQAAVSEADRLLRTARLKGRRSAKSGGVE
jgi:hypothetical protein